MSSLETLMIAMVCTTIFMVLVAVTEALRGIYRLLFGKKKWERM